MHKCRTRIVSYEQEYIDRTEKQAQKHHIIVVAKDRKKRKKKKKIQEMKLPNPKGQRLNLKKTLGKGKRDDREAGCIPVRTSIIMPMPIKDGVQLVLYFQDQMKWGMAAALSNVWWWRSARIAVFRKYTMKASELHRRSHFI